MLEMQRRSWPEIIGDILEVALVPTNKTRIMYSSKLSFGRFNRYFYDLLRRGFIEETNDSNERSVYKTSERGRDLLEVLRTVQELFFRNSSGARYS